MSRSGGTLVCGLRRDCLNLLPYLRGHFKLIDTATAVEQFPPYPHEIPKNKFRYPEVLAQYWQSATGYIDTILDLDDLAGVLVWNSCQAPFRAMCLAARERGIPSFEVDHGCFATYLHGHFEVDPSAAHVFCSPEHAAFLRAYKCKSEIYEYGRPAYDTWEPVSIPEARAKLEIGIDGPLVLATTTWTHELSAWSDPKFQLRAEGTLVAAMMIVQKVHPCAFMVSMRSTSQEEAETRGKLLERAGLTDVIVVRADEYGLQDLIPCADVVVSPKGSAAAEAVIAGRPAIVNDLRPQLDEWAWREKGIIASRSDDPQKLAEAIVKCMHDEETILRLEAERRDGRLWFNGPGGASEKIGRKIVEVCDGS